MKFTSNTALAHRITDAETIVLDEETIYEIYVCLYLSFYILNSVFI